jgi:tetratricopeptide (TPR) repeat protein
MRRICRITGVLAAFLLVFMACSPEKGGDNNAATEDKKVPAEAAPLSIEELTGAISQSPDSPEAYYARGDAYFELGDFPKALEDLQRAVELAPDHVDAYILIGIVHGEAGDIDKAIESFNRAVGMAPENTTAYVNRGRAHAIGNSPALACADWKKACRLGACKSYDLSILRGECSP